MRLDGMFYTDFYSVGPLEGRRTSPEDFKRIVSAGIAIGGILHQHSMPIRSLELNCEFNICHFHRSLPRVTAPTPSTRFSSIRLPFHPTPSSSLPSSHRSFSYTGIPASISSISRQDQVRYIVSEYIHAGAYE